MKTHTVSIKIVGPDAIVRTEVNTFAVTIGSNKNRKNSSPIELLLSSLGSWIALTVSAVAENKKINLEKLEIKIDFKIIDVRTYTCNYKILLDFGSGLDRRGRSILFAAARSCHVGKILKGKLDFDYSLESPNDDNGNGKKTEKTWTFIHILAPDIRL